MQTIVAPDSSQRRRYQRQRRRPMGATDARGLASADPDLTTAPEEAGLGTHTTPEDTGGAAANAAKTGQRVFRVWGHDPANPDLARSQSGPGGRSWTRVNPGSVAKYRYAAGLPDESNMGRFVSEGILTDPTGVKVATATTIGSNLGGLDELIVPSPETQIELRGVFGVNPPF
ncbi:MAG: hypothetical protein ACREP9_06565 [Candidatus Dormibacteraceae bacterium]